MKISKEKKKKRGGEKLIGLVLLLFYVFCPEGGDTLQTKKFKDYYNTVFPHVQHQGVKFKLCAFYCNIPSNKTSTL